MRRGARIAGELGDGFAPTMPIKEVTGTHLLQLLHLFKQIKFPPPDGSVRAAQLIRSRVRAGA